MEPGVDNARSRMPYKAMHSRTTTRHASDGGGSVADNMEYRSDFAPIVEGDLLEAAEQWIVHQCNCVSIGARGVAKSIFNKYPHANVYRERSMGAVHKFGTIETRGGEHGQRGVINLFGQINPGKPRRSGLDTVSGRFVAFKQALQKIAEIPGLASVAFPYQIGCGLAGGDWLLYNKAIQEFSKMVRPFEIKVVIYKLGDAHFDHRTREYIGRSIMQRSRNSVT